MGSCCSTDDNGRSSGADLKKPLTTAAASPPPLQAVQSPAVEADNVEVSVPSVSEVREGGVDCDKAEMNTSAVPLATDIDWTPEEGKLKAGGGAARKCARVEMDGSL